MTQPVHTGQLINNLRSLGQHEVADWVAMVAVKGRTIEEQRWIDEGCPEDG